MRERIPLRLCFKGLVSSRLRKEAYRSKASIHVRADDSGICDVGVVEQSQFKLCW